jgi:uncharacterized protein (TIGR03435 family)
VRRARAALVIGVCLAMYATLVAARLAHARSSDSTNTSRAEFEVVSIKPNNSGSGVVLFGVHDPGRFTVTNANVKTLVAWAYNTTASFQLSDDRVVGGPAWITSEKYNIDAKEEDSAVQKLQDLAADQSTDQIRLMVQSLLADRFKLRIHHETRDLPIYALVVAKNGPKLIRSMKESSLRFSHHGRNRRDRYPCSRHSTDAIAASADWMRAARTRRSRSG